MTAEISLQDLAVFCAVENCSPGFELSHTLRSFFRVQLGHSPVVDVLSAAHRVGEMHLPVVAVVHVPHRRGHAAPGHNGVSLAEQRLAHKPDRNARRRRLDSRTQARSAGTYDKNVMFECWIISHLSDRRLPACNCGNSPILMKT